MARVDNPASPLVPRLKGLHLFHFDGAPCAQRVRFALHEKGLARGREVKFDAQDAAACRGEDGAWVSRQVSLIRKEHMTEFYARIQPNLVVPALVHDGSLYIESMDIIEYLDDAFGGPPLIPRHDADMMADAERLTTRGKALHRSVRFVTFRWGLRGLARLSGDEEQQLKDLLASATDAEQLVSFYSGFDQNRIEEAVYLDHLRQLKQAFADLEQRLSDGRQYLCGDTLTMADIIWAMKTLRLLECDYPFDEIYPQYSTWFKRIAARPAFTEGVMGKHRLMSRTFRAKARIERWLGVGLRRQVMNQVG